MTPEDTTRLRERAEAVRDAGAKSAYAHLVVKRLVDAGHFDLTSVRKDARNAADDLRAAQKALYRAAPPDGIILALLDEVDRLRAQVAEAYPRALQAAASLVVRDVYGSDLEPGLADEIADGILDLSNEEIDAFAAQSEADHAAAQVAEHYVCPGCHVVDDEPCLPGCIDAEIEGERRRPFDGFSEFNADDEGDEPEEGGTR